MGERWLDVQQDLGRGWQLSFLIAVRAGGGGGVEGWSPRMAEQFSGMVLSGGRYDDVKIVLDPCQFTYKANHGTDDAINTLWHLVLKHPKAYAWVPFVEFSSAFNTIQPNVLLEKNGTILFWQIKSHSLSLTTNTGVPHRYVSSPLLYTLYTNDLQMTLQSSANCLPLATLTHTSLRWISSQNGALTTSLN